MVKATDAVITVNNDVKEAVMHWVFEPTRCMYDTKESM